MLRPYQLKAIEMLRAEYHNRPILCVPTGGGKTTVAAEIIRRTLARGNRALFLVHRQELVAQAVTRLADFGIEAGRILAGHPEDLNLPCQVASIPTLARRDHWPADLLVVDEAAHAASQSWRTLLARYPDAWVIGLTATPARLDGKALDECFGCILEPVTVQDLIRDGYLVEPQVWAPPVDLAGVPLRGGDYDPLEVVDRMTKLSGNIVDHWHEKAFGMRTVLFACTVEHSEALVERFREVGVRARHLDGKTPRATRAGILQDLKDGRLDLVSNCMVLSEGWDLPALQCCILARPTKSLALHRQMVGRVMRPPGPVIVLDHAGNHHEHGPVTLPMEWSLSGRPRRVPGTPQPRTCRQCYALIPSGEPVCPECGARMQPSVPVPPQETHEKLVQFLGSKSDRATREKEYRRLVMKASRQHYKLGWARNQYRARFGKWPRFPYIERLYECPDHEWEMKQYGPKRVLRCAWCFREA